MKEYMAGEAERGSPDQGAPERDTSTKGRGSPRPRREEREGREGRDSADPSATPTGKFFLHDDRSAGPGSASIHPLSRDDDRHDRGPR